MSTKPVGVGAQKPKGNKVKIGSKKMVEKGKLDLTLEDKSFFASWLEFVDPWPLEITPLLLKWSW